MNQTAQFQFESASVTHPGRVRALNQDALLALPELGIWVVADGVGGHKRGDVASQAIVEAIAALRGQAIDDTVEAVRAALLAVNKKLIQLAADMEPGAIIGSTVAVLVARAGQCVCLWAGDSRIYGFRLGKLSRLTRDHSQVEELVARGQLTPAEALRHPDANIIYRAVGNRAELELDAQVYEMHEGDKFLLCTDGLTKEVDDSEIAQLLTAGTCHDNAQALVERALQQAGRDNIAVIVVDVRPAVDLDSTVRIRRTALRDRGG